jgi:eukaryotic translation initiation factor 2C
MGELAVIQHKAQSSSRAIQSVVYSSLPPALRAQIVAITGAKMPRRHDLRLQQAFPQLDGESMKTNRFQINMAGIPDRIYGYALSVYRFDRVINSYGAEDIVHQEDERVLASIVLKMKDNHPEWGDIPGAYDGRTRLFSPFHLNLPHRNSRNEPCIVEDFIPVGNKLFRAILTEVEVISTSPRAGRNGSAFAFPEAVSCGHAMSVALLSFIRYDTDNMSPAWFAVGSKAFAASGTGGFLAPGYEARKGFHVVVKQSLCGLNLELDMSVSCFLVGGPMLNAIATILRCRYITELLSNWQYGPHKHDVDAVNAVIKNCKVRLTHLHHTKKCRGLGPIANHPDSEFSPEVGGPRMTVAQYFANMAAQKKPYYRVLMYPFLPTVDVGTSTKPILIPLELVDIMPGQCKPGKVNTEMTAEMIKVAASKPGERLEYLEGYESVLHAVVRDPINQSFGLGNVEVRTLSVPCSILPAPVLQYRDSTVEPELKGSWFTSGTQCIRSPPLQPGSNATQYGVLLIGDNRFPPEGWIDTVKRFCLDIENEARLFGWTYKMACQPMRRRNHVTDIANALIEMRARKCDSVLVLLLEGNPNSYSNVKMASDPLAMVTSCAQWKKAQKAAEGQLRGYTANFVVKMTSKLGGITHVLASRATSAPSYAVFQSPPASLSWLCDRPCMFVGIDVSHPEVGGVGDSVAAVVASLDGHFKDYAAHISVQKTCRAETVTQLEEAMLSLLRTFLEKNGSMPETIVIYRDGVSDSQFSMVLDQELPFLKSAIMQLGYSAESVKVVIIVCQKGHHTRLVYEDGDKNVLNPCPGLCVDGLDPRSICSGEYNEFYLSSGIAIQGTSKPCKYAIIYDELGLLVRLLMLLAGLVH